MQENQAKLFQQYMQFDANKLQGGRGSGLGLWSKLSPIAYVSNPCLTHDLNHSFEGHH